MRNNFILKKLAIVLAVLLFEFTIIYAQSAKDGYSTMTQPGQITWTKYVNNPVLSHGTGWENYLVHPFIFKDANDYKLYYAGMLPNQMEIGLATSPDGINWTKSQNNPVIPRSWQGWASFRTITGSVIKVQNTYYAFYQGNNQNLNAISSIGVATSNNGENWTAYNGNPIISYSMIPPGNKTLSRPWCVYAANQFQLYFHSDNEWRYATSIDGTNWTINTNPSINLPINVQSIIYESGTYYAIRPQSPGFPNRDILEIYQSIDGFNWDLLGSGELLPYQNWQNSTQDYYSFLYDPALSRFSLFFTGGYQTWGMRFIGLASGVLNNIPTSHEFVVLADKRIKSNGAAYSDGDMHCNDRIEFKKGRPSTHYGSLSALERIEIRERNTITEDVTCGENVLLFKDALVEGTITKNASISEIPLPSVPDVAFGTENIEVERGGYLLLPPGDYKNVKIQKEAVLSIRSGVYNLKGLQVGKGATLEVNTTAGEVIVNINNNLDINHDVKMLIINGSSRDVTFNVTGSGVKFRKRSIWYGNIIAPFAKAQIFKEAFFQGSLCVEQIDIHKNSVIIGHGSLYTAKEAQSVFDIPEVSANDVAAIIPESFELKQNYPNPFNPTTTITFTIPETSNLTLKIYNINGQLVRTLVNGTYEPGTHNLIWDTVSDNGSRVSSGIYFYQLVSKDFKEMKKMLLLK